MTMDDISGRGRHQREGAREYTALLRGMDIGEDGLMWFQGLEYPF